MYALQPTKIWRYLAFKQLVVPSSFRRFFYTSWEDAMWDLLQFFNGSDNSICLVPEFFCMDVVNNMETHGLSCIFYPVDTQLQTDPIIFASYLIKYQPKVVIVLHTVGITNQLFAHNKSWLKYLPANALLIEDSVHRLVDPQLICLLTPRHFVIDSLRKVAPLYGSNLFGDASTLRNFKQSAWWLTLSYQLKVFWWWWLFQLHLHIAVLPMLKRHNRWWNTQAQKYLQKGYDLIGDSERAAPGPWLFKILASYLSVTTIEKIKIQQVARYLSLLKSCWTNSNLYYIHFDQADAGKLRGFPIGISSTNADQLLLQLQKNQLAWKYELDDCPWSKRQKIIYLPLGPHIELNEVDTICQLFITALKNVNSVVS